MFKIEITRADPHLEKSISRLWRRLKKEVICFFIRRGDQYLIKYTLTVFVFMLVADPRGQQKLQSTRL